MLLTVLITIVVAAYIVESLLDYLNQSTARNPLDSKIAHLYDQAEREKSIAYSAEKTNFGFVSSTFSTIVMILALAYGWFAVLDDFLRERFDNEIVISLLFIAALSVISWWLNLPFQLYSIFRIEAKYGFNKTTFSTFVSDALKGSLLALVLGEQCCQPLCGSIKNLVASSGYLLGRLFRSSHYLCLCSELL